MALVVRSLLQLVQNNSYIGIDLICDPSHIAGNTKLLESISKKALKKGMKGLMIEAHCCPNILVRSFLNFNSLEVLI